jgi:hypothetical protein
LSRRSRQTDNHVAKEYNHGRSYGPRRQLDRANIIVQRPAGDYLPGQFG